MSKKTLKRVLRWTSLLSFIAIWEGAARANLVDPLFLSSPSAILVKLVQMIMDGSLWPHLFASGEILIIGLVLSVVVGIPLGILMGRSEIVRSTLEPYVAAIYAAPQVAFLPLLIIWLGIGVASKVALIFLGTFVVIVVNTEAGIRQTDARLIEMVRSFTANERQQLTFVAIPSALPFIMTGLRLATGRALVMVVVAEIYAANKGLGYLIFQAGGMYDTSQVFVGLVVLAAAGVTMNAGLRFLETKLLPWNQE